MIKLNFFILVCYLLFISISVAQEPANLLLEHKIIGSHNDDFSMMSKRKKIRALVTYNRTGFFFTDKGTPQGLQVDLLTEYEKHLNVGIKKEIDKIHIQYIPTTFDRLITDLLEGKGDIVLV